MPVATPDAAPTLDLMSLRTMPLSVRTLGPFVPSPGYGPAVSFGIWAQLASVAVVVVVAAGVVVVEVVLVLAFADVLLVAPLLPPPPQLATKTAAPRPPSSASTSRRVLAATSNSLTASLLESGIVSYVSESMRATVKNSAMAT